MLNTYSLKFRRKIETVKEFSCFNLLNDDIVLSTLDKIEKINIVSGNISIFAEKQSFREFISNINTIDKDSFVEQIISSNYPLKYIAKLMRNINKDLICNSNETHIIRQFLLNFIEFSISKKQNPLSPLSEFAVIKQICDVLEPFWDEINRTHEIIFDSKTKEIILLNSVTK